MHEGFEEDRSVRVLLVDDDALVRAGLRLILGGRPTIEVVGEAADGIEAVAAVAAHRPDIVLMDIRMPRQDGITTTAQLLDGARGDAKAPQVIVLTTFDADDHVVMALRAGASGFLLKDTPPAQIVEAVLRVHAGEPMLSPSITQQLIGAVAAGTPDPRKADAVRLVETLSDRERQIAVAIGEGCTNAEIAARLYLSVATVKAHVTHLLTKLDAENRVQIAIRAHDAGLL
ncbi:response regulator transcription factor [Arsenicicoccus piscis]|uniref:DNA-binding response regulator n=1 Tax=Arsenicicoccus piscis TaxID=673954 RepID=A0ABQ6HLB5_9MICO|nr:response regulator transcription factor [Arsenicicoccus piscis]MCH8626841.1 response regulator transcription factor [Arsenicicoccus piscis]GMA19254.1 DNA-binding response regulator [Arsenicicoccus piscis]